MLGNMVCDITYMVKQEFSTVTYFFSYCAVMTLRILVPVFLAGIYIKTKVVGKKPVAFTFDIDQEQRAELQKRYTCAGILLYTAVPMTFISGVYRILPVKNFARDVATGFCLDLAYILTIFFLQALNNSTLQTEELEKALATDEL